MRLALAQINSVVGDLDGNRARDPRAARRGARRRRRPRPLPGARRHRLPARGSAAPARRSSAPRAARSRRSRARRAASPRSSARRTSTPTSTTPASCSRDGEVRGVYRKRFLPNYGVFDEDRYFAPGDDLAAAALRRRRRRADDLRGHLAARPAGDRPRARRRAARREHLRVAVPRRQGPRARGDAAGARARQLVLRRALQRGRRAGRADLRRPLGRARRRGRGARARAPGFEEALLVVDVDPVAAVGRRLRDVRRRALARERADRAELDEVELAPPREQAEPLAPGAGRAARRPRADAARARARPARLRRRRTASATS